ncbi:MAG: endolytic transglycosylase MltG [Clostridiales bacterium]|jgi:UPF0755 protein|nr:endolytic transglycosylase MltG [Clostridiales bacterium]
MNKNISKNKQKWNNFVFWLKKFFFKELKNVTIITLISIFLLFFLGFTLDIYGYRQNNKNSLNIKVSIPKDSSINKISSILKENKVIKCKNVFKIFSQMMKNYSNFKYGNHTFNSNMSYYEIFEELKKIPEIPKVIVVIPEGFNLDEIIKRLCEKKIACKEKLLDELKNGEFDYPFIKKNNRKEKKLEGYLFPATYEILEDESEHTIINKMLKKFSQVVPPIYEKSGSEYSLDEIVIIASIIEKESFPNDMRNVSSVFHNRLKQGMNLGSCATVMYALGTKKENLNVKDTKICSPYNTYLKKGLPIGPISCPGLKAIEAALQPENTDYFYFVKSKDGLNHIFNKNFNEHLNASR